jgi:hypothetical protein
MDEYAVSAYSDGTSINIIGFLAPPLAKQEMNMKARDLLLSALLSIAAVTPVMAHAPRPVILFSRQSTRTFTHQQLLALLGSARRQRTSLALFLRNSNIVPGRTVPIFGSRTSLSVVAPTTHLQPIITTALLRDNLGLGHEHIFENIVSKEENGAVREEEVSAEKVLDRVVEHSPIELPKVLESEAPKLIVESPKLIVESPKLIVESPKLIVESPKLIVESPKLIVESPKLIVTSIKDGLERNDLSRSLTNQGLFDLRRSTEIQVAEAPSLERELELLRVKSVLDSFAKSRFVTLSPHFEFPF